jgi:hypothetical protein
MTTYNKADFQLKEPRPHYVPLDLSLVGRILSDWRKWLAVVAQARLCVFGDRPS